MFFSVSSHSSRYIQSLKSCFFSTVKIKEIKMSNLITKLQDALQSIDEKYLDDLESENCGKCMEKLNVHIQFTTDLLHVPMSCSSFDETYEKFANHCFTIREALNNETESGKKAIESVSEGMMKLFANFKLNLNYDSLSLLFLLWHWQSRICSNGCFGIIATAPKRIMA